MENTLPKQSNTPVFDDAMSKKIVERAKEIEKNPPQWQTLDDLKKALAEV